MSPITEICPTGRQIIVFIQINDYNTQIYVSLIPNLYWLSNQWILDSIKTEHLCLYKHDISKTKIFPRLNITHIIKIPFNKPKMFALKGSLICNSKHKLQHRSCTNVVYMKIMIFPMFIIINMFCWFLTRFYSIYFRVNSSQ